MTNELKVGILGLGAMGLGMASCLVKSGFSVTGFDINSSAMTRLESEGGRIANTPRAVATDADVLIVVVATSDQASSALFDPDNGAVASLPPHGLILFCITAAPEYMCGVKEKLEVVGRPDLRVVDCPISGGEVRAWEGTLSLICAGSETDIEYVREILSFLSSQLHVIPGGIGAGSSLKMVHQVLVGVHILASVEVMGLAYVAGLELASVYDAVMKSDGMSWLFGQRAAHMLNKREVPASSLMIITKDFGMLHASAKANKIPAPLSSLVHQIFVQASGRGDTTDDCRTMDLYLFGKGNLEDLGGTEHLLSTISRRVDERGIIRLLVGIHTAVAVEVLRFAKRLSLDLSALGAVVKDAAGSSVMFSKISTQLEDQENINISLQSVKGHEQIREDLTSAVEAAESLKYPLFLSSMALQQFYSEKLT